MGWKKHIRNIHTKTVIGCSVFFENDSLTINACVIKRKGKNASIQATYSNLEFEGLKEITNPNIPLLLSLTGELVVIKPLKIPKGNDWRQVVNSLFPHMHDAEFAVQFYQTHDDAGFVSFVRRASLDDLLNKFTHAGLQVFDFFLGPFAVEYVLELLQDSKTLDVCNYRVGVSQNRIIDLQRISKEEGEQIQLGSGFVQQDSIVAYASGLSFFVDEPLSIETKLDNYAHLQFQYYAKAITAILITRLLPVLFFVALSGTIVGWYYSDQLKKLSDVQALYLAKQQMHKRKDADHERVKTIVSQLRWDRVAFASYYGDRFAKTVPRSITIHRLEIFPQDANKNILIESTFSTSSIFVAGMTDKPEILVSWLKQLSGTSWIKAINDKKYRWDDNKEKGEFSFEILLNEVN